MSGLPPKKVYLYDTDGKYLQEFENSSLFCRTFGFSENLFSTENRRKDYQVYEFEDGRVAALYRIGKDGIRKYRQYKNSPYTKNYAGRNIAESVLKKNGKVKGIAVYNLDGELVATFRNTYFYKKMTGQAEPPFKNFNDEGLSFKYI